MTIEDNLITTVDSTGTPLFPAELATSPLSSGKSFDYMIRVSGQDLSGTQDVSIAWAHTSMLTAALAKAWQEHTSRDITTLVDLIRWQHRVLDYNSHYNAFLLNQISEEEFEALSTQIAYEPKDQLAEELLRKIRTIIALTGIDYTASDFASLFQCSRDTIDKAMDSL